MSQIVVADVVESSPRLRLARRGSHFLVGYLGLAALPLLIVADTALALLRGWSPVSEGVFGRLWLLAAMLVVLLVLPCVLTSYRRVLRECAAQFWLASDAGLIGLLFSEIVLAGFLPAASFHCRPPRAVYNFDPDYALMPGVNGPARSTMNDQGLRGEKRPEGGYRILCLGGSTTECLYLDDRECWPDLLGKCLRESVAQNIWVGSAAVTDFASGHHERFLEQSRIVSAVDCVIVLVGANDVARMIFGLDAGDASPPFWLRLRAIEFLKQIWNVRLGKGLIVDYDGTVLLGKRRLREIGPPLGELDEKRALNAYADRLRRLVQAARRRGVRLVLVTQPVLWDYQLPALVQERLLLARMKPQPRAWAYLRPGTLRDAMDRFNLRLKAVAAESGAEIIDAAPQMSSAANYFYDDYHFSEQGCREFARLLCDHLSPTIPKPRSETATAH